MTLVICHKLINRFGNPASEKSYQKSTDVIDLEVDHLDFIVNMVYQTIILIYLLVFEKSCTYAENRRVKGY